MVDSCMYSLFVCFASFLLGFLLGFLLVFLLGFLLVFLLGFVRVPASVFIRVLDSASVSVHVGFLFIRSGGPLTSPGGLVEVCVRCAVHVWRSHGWTERGRDATTA